MKDRIRLLEKERAASVLENFTDLARLYQYNYPEEIKALSEEALLDLFTDETSRLRLKYKAAEVLMSKNSVRFARFFFQFLNSVVDLDLNIVRNLEMWHYLLDVSNMLRCFTIPEAYHDMKKFLNRLITEDVKHKYLFLMEAVCAVAEMSLELNVRDAIPMLKWAIFHLKPPIDDDLQIIAMYFYRLNEPEGIKDILTKHLTSEMPDVETRCLELLQKHDPEFVKDWKAGKAAVNDLSCY